MLSTYQFENQNMLEHGFSVKKSFDLIKDKILNNNLQDLESFGFPVSCGKLLLDSIKDIESFNTYMVYHDCGKPDSKIIVEGRVHYPNHAEISSIKFKYHAKNIIKADKLDYICNLINLDMEFHSKKIEELKDFISNNEYATSLYLSAWASLISNAEMFGGYQSESFKIKAKKLKKIGKLFENKNGDKK